MTPAELYELTEERARAHASNGARPHDERGTDDRDGEVGPDAGASVSASETADKKPRWHRCSDLVDMILARANEPWIALKLGAEELVSIRPGGIAVLMGPTGAGKSSLAMGMLLAHVADGGVAVVLSRELPGDEFAARTIGMQTETSWVDVLKGRVSRSEMERVLPDRLRVLDRRDATLGALTEHVAYARAMWPDAPILACVDYLQILESADRDARAKDTRAKVSDVVLEIDDIARRFRIGMLALSQMSRTSSRLARAGEVLGADSTDGGAESSAIERAATVTLCIGASGPDREDGTCALDLSIGKGRMTGGDRVVPLNHCRRTGRCRIAGVSRSAAEVRAERDGRRNSEQRKTDKLAIVAAAGKATEPQTRKALGDLAGVRNAARRTAAIREAIDLGELVEVERSARRSDARKVWTRERATAMGVPIVESEARS